MGLGHSTEFIEEYQNFAREKLGFEFHNPELLITALTHRSYINEHKNAEIEHNERLEFLGDALLEIIVSEFLYRNYHEPEGVMTAWRSALVRTESIGAAGHELGYEPLIRLSRGEQNGTDRSHESIVADCFEALSGAIYLDQGFEVVKEFVTKHILSKIDEILADESWRDPKSYAQEFAQKNDGITPQYRTMKEEGPDHARTFTVGIYVGKHLRGVGVGSSKQDAQTAAAKEAIKYYKKIGAKV